jgi:putative ABC transport system permease protein
LLLSVQIAVALTLTIDATLLIRSFQRLLQIDPGFRSQQVLTAHLSLSPHRYTNLEDRKRFCEQLRQRLQVLPGVESVALVDNMPQYAVHYTSFEIEGKPIPEPNTAPSANDAHVTPDFLRALNINLLNGRHFTDQDATTNPPNVVIVNAALARRLWPKQTPIGAHIRPLAINGSPGPWQTVIGVMADFHQFNTETPARPQLLWPAKVFSEMTIVLRTTGPDPLDLAPSLQQTVWSIDHDQPVTDIQTFEHIVVHHNSQRRFNMLALTTFATFSVLLTLLGLYGLISSFLASQIRAIGIRLALGARRLQVCLALVRPAAPPIVSGILLGLLASFLSRRLIANILFQVSPLDPQTYIATSVGLIFILIFTSLSATIRAARLDPSKVLREE